MGQIRCPFCHQYIDALAYPMHAAAHKKIRADGQQQEYATLPAEERVQGKLDAVPVVYRHQKCGVSTRMPDEIVRSYLKNPYMYSGGTFCVGCKKHVPHRECFWRETGENLQVYFDRLRATTPRPKGKGCLFVLMVAGVPVGIALLSRWM